VLVALLSTQALLPYFRAGGYADSSSLPGVAVVLPPILLALAIGGGNTIAGVKNYNASSMYKPYCAARTAGSILCALLALSSWILLGVKIDGSQAFSYYTVVLRAAALDRGGWLSPLEHAVSSGLMIMSSSRFGGIQSPARACTCAPNLGPSSSP
jgi:hypothetical protein